jgi:hypothetical protein
MYNWPVSASLPKSITFSLIILSTWAKLIVHLAKQ